MLIAPSSPCCASGRIETGMLSRPPVTLCTNPPLGRLPCAAPWGTVSVCSCEDWGLTPPFRCPSPSPLPPRAQRQGRGGVAASPPLLTGPPAQPTGGGNGGALPAASTTGLPSQCGAQPLAAAASPVFSWARESPREELLWGEGDHNHPLPAQNSGSLPAVSWGGGDHNHPRPTQAAAGHVEDAMGKGKPSSPFPSEQPRAAAPAGPRGRPGRGDTPPIGGTRVPAPAHQGGSKTPILAHGRASHKVT